MVWSRYERYRWAGVLFLGNLGLYASRNIMPITSTALAEEMQWSRRELGILMGIFFWGYAVTQYMAGYLSDILGGEVVIVLSSFGWSFSTLCFTILPEFGLTSAGIYRLFLVLRFCFGLFQGFYYPSLASLMASQVRLPNRNSTYSLISAGAHLGTLLCGSLGSYLITVQGWRAPFFFFGILYILWAFIVHRYLVRNLIRDRMSKVIPIQMNCSYSCMRINESEPRTASIVSCNNNPPVPISKVEFTDLEKLAPSTDEYLPLPPQSKSLRWSFLLTYPPFWVMLCANFAHNNAFYIILNWCPTYFHDNYPDARSWVFNMVPWIITFPTALSSGFIADRWIAKGFSVTIVRKAINTVVLVGSSIFLLILSRLDNYYSSLICMACALACLGFHNSGILLNPQDMAPNHGGQLFGIMSTVGTIPGFAGVYMVGYLLEYTGQWSMVFILTAVISVAGWVLYTLYGSSEPAL